MLDRSLPLSVLQVRLVNLGLYRLRMSLQVQDRCLGIRQPLWPRMASVAHRKTRTSRPLELVVRRSCLQRRHQLLSIHSHLCQWGWARSTITVLVPAYLL